MIENLKAGATIQCTVKSVPMAKGPRDTVARLMRKDPANNRALRRGQRTRRQTTPTHQRGGREWAVRPTAGKVVKVKAGETWSMIFTPDIANDLRSIESYITIKG